MTDNHTDTEDEMATEELRLGIDAEQTLKIGNDKPIRISTGHRIMHHDGKCSRPHGHNYEITVDITGAIDDRGWVVDKGEVTSIIDEWDHMFLVEQGDPLIEAFKSTSDEDSLVVLEHPPTAEIMAELLQRKLQNELNENVTDISVSVSETGELCAVK